MTLEYHHVNLDSSNKIRFQTHDNIGAQDMIGDSKKQVLKVLRILQAEMMWLP